MVIPGEYLSSICEVKTMNNTLVATGMIDKITEDYLEISVKSGKTAAIHFGEEVKVNIFNSRWGFRVLVGGVYTSSVGFIRLTEVTSILDYERRHFFRVDIEMNANACLPKKKKKDRLSELLSDKELYVSDEGIMDDTGTIKPLDIAQEEHASREVDEAEESRRIYAMIEDKSFDKFTKSFSRNGDPPEGCELLPIKIKNLSISGLMFASDHIFENGVVWIQMRIERFNGPFPCRIKRVQEGNKKEILYGCEFIKMSDEVANALCRYIFQRQREQISQTGKPD